ncbi:MAG: type II secretion system secretin GspD [Piscirickettsiaceae bacterium]|nr:type II secretion system secretin GspD [Piscirickettsiaceae bacterium]
MQRWVVSFLAISVLTITTSMAEEDLITLNMKDADITTFITDIGQMTGKAFIIDPRVKGKVTIITQHPMTQDEVYQVFISTLNVHGFTAVKANGITKIVPTANVKQDVMKIASTRSPGHGDEYVTRVIQLDQVSAQEILPLVKPMMAKNAHLAAYAPSNVLIVIDRADNVQRIVKLINRIDTASNQEVEIVPLKYAAAADVVRMLKQIDKPLVGKKEVPERVTTYVADERTNAILLRGEFAARTRIKEVISQLDSPLASDTGNIKVIYLHNANAVDLAKVLNGVKDNIEMQAMANQGGLAKPNAAKIKSSVNNKTKTSIQADEGTNSLLISAAPDVMRSLEAVIKQLDIRRAQVLVEAIIVELTDKQSSELGVQWLGVGGAVGVLTSFPGSGLDPAELLGAAVSGSTEDVAAAIGGAKGLNLGFGVESGSSGFGAILHALATDDDANILSTPSIITMDNEEASIIVGQEVPFITGSTTGSNNSNPFTTVTRKKVGVKLIITPQINEGDAVRLKIYQEVSGVTTATGATDLITNQREISTTVLVQDGATIVLGGLISEEHSEGVQKIPLLGDLPIIGGLFKTTKVNKERRNLMVFIHPTIIRDDKLLNEISGRKYSFIRKQQLAMQEEGISLMRNATPALLPTWDKTEVLPWQN